MKKILLFGLVVVFASSLSACGKKKESLEEMQGPLSMESLNRMETETVVTTETKAPTAVVTPAVSASKTPESLPPSGPYKPTLLEIQTALKNAGFYTGTIDGKTGPMTKKAIEEFQKAKALEADGKVGPKTWAVLSTYLTSAATAPVKSKKR